MSFPRTLVATRSAATALGVLAVLAVLALAGCGTNANPGAGGTSPTAQPPSPSTTTDPSGGATARPTAPGTSGGPLLSAVDLPALGAHGPWTQGQTGPANAAPVSACEEYDLATIGAKAVTARSFTAAGTTTAVEQLATFPDAMTAVRASRVMDSWHTTCQKRVRTVGKDLRVGPVNAVPVASGTAGWYVADWIAPGSSTRHYQALGMVMNQARIAFVTIDWDGALPGSTQPPMAAVLQAAGRRL